MKKNAEYVTDAETLTARFEGDNDDIDVTLNGDRGREICLTVSAGSPDELLLRRVSDQQEDEYRISGKLLRQNAVNEVRIVPCKFEGIDCFNQFGINVYEVKYGASYRET